MIIILKDFIKNIWLRFKEPHVEFNGIIYFSLKNYNLKFGKNVRIGRNVLFQGNVSIGNNSYINNNSNIETSENGSVTIGDNVAIGKRVFILPCQRDITIERLRDTVRVPYHLTIEDDVWIGSNVVLLKGITIGKSSVIGAGSVVTKDVKPYTVVAGNPAKFIKNRR